MLEPGRMTPPLYREPRTDFEACCKRAAPAPKPRWHGAMVAFTAFTAGYIATLATFHHAAGRPVDASIDLALAAVNVLLAWYWIARD
jgi:hypothetical protein